MKMVISLLIMLGIFLLVGTKLVSGASWSAYVVDSNTQTGLNNVNVTALKLSDNTYLNITFTNVNGFFQIFIPDSTGIRFILSKQGYLTDNSTTLPGIPAESWPADSTLPFNLTLTKETTGNITGRIKNSTGSDIENANISAIQGSSIINSTLSDSNGNYILAYLLDGTYTLEVSALGHVTQNITNVVLQPNSTININFLLAKETVPPIISNLGANLITSSEAVIIWQTDEEANSSVNYWKEGQTVLSSYSSTLVSSHLMRLSSLSSSTFYYYNVSSCDFAGNCNSSNTYNFTTLAQAGNGIDGDGVGGGGGVGALTSTTKFVGEGIRIIINVDGEIHYVRIIKITNTTVTINISSTPQQAILSIGEEKKFEVTDDDFYDILIKLNNIENDKANITISYIHEEIPSQLFDIGLELEDNSISNFKKLVAIVTFESFGTEPTPVNLLFTILNETGGEVHSEDDYIVVETEEVLRKSFEGVDLPRGKYTFILTTLYNVDVVDEFRQEFEITWWKINWIWIGVGIIAVLVISLIWLLKIKLKEEGGQKDKNQNLQKVRKGTLS